MSFLGLIFLYIGFVSRMSAQELLKAPCTIEDLENVCRILEGVGNQDLVQFSNGSVMPGCALRSREAAMDRERDTYIKETLAEFARALKAMPLDVIGDQRENLMDRRTLPLVDPPSEEIAWPPGTLIKKRKVSREEWQEWQKKLNTPQGQRLIAAAEKKEKIGDYSLEKLPVTYQKSHRTREQAVLDFARKAVRKRIERGRRELDLLSTERAILLRLKSLKLMGEAQQNVDRVCGSGEAAFFDFEGRIGIRHEHQFLPDGALVRMVAHEIAHSFDGCSLSFNFLDGGLDTPFFRGKVKKLLSSGIAMDDHPFKGAYACLAHPSGGNFGERPRVEAGKCDHTLHDEVFCDWLSTFIVAEYLREKPTFGVKETLPQIKFPLNGIKIRVPNNMETMFFTIDQACEERHGATSSNASGSYPSWVNRYFNIMLRNPVIAKELNCPTTGRECEFPVGKIVTPSSAAEATR